ncbi:MAG: hypothetical protein ACYCSN_14675 [Acidobacteriaceae bacterium]
MGYIDIELNAPNVLKVVGIAVIGTYLVYLLFGWLAKTFPNPATAGALTVVEHG